MPWYIVHVPQEYRDIYVVKAKDRDDACALRGRYHYRGQIEVETCATEVVFGPYDTLEDLEEDDNCIPDIPAPKRQ